MLKWLSSFDKAEAQEFSHAICFVYDKIYIHKWKKIFFQCINMYFITYKNDRTKHFLSVSQSSAI